MDLQHGQRQHPLSGIALLFPTANPFGGALALEFENPIVVVKLSGAGYAGGAQIDVEPRDGKTRR